MNKSKTRNVKKSPGRPTRENTKRRTVIFDNDLWKSLKIMAIVEGTNITEMIHRAVKEYITHHGLPKEQEIIKAVLKQIKMLEK